MCSKGPIRSYGTMLKLKSVIGGLRLCSGRSTPIEGCQTRCLSLLPGEAPLARLRPQIDQPDVKRHKSTIPSLVPSTTTSSLLSFGQPTHASHPEFFKEDSSEVLPGITREEFRERRSRVCTLTRQLYGRRFGDTNHLIIIPGSSKKYMSENIPYPFRPNSNFFYLSGSYDQEAFIVLTSVATPNGEEQHDAIFLNDPDPTSELWDGRKTTPSAAVQHYGFESGHLISEFEAFLHEFLKKASKKYVIWCEDRSFVERLTKAYVSTSLSFQSELKLSQSPKGIIDSLRVIKSPAEIKLMQKSCEIAGEAFQKTINFCANTPMISEHQLWAKLDYECRVRGADRLAYPPVVASGNRANIIHYVFNANKCKDTELVLVDAGCEFFGYCSDITRTWPVSGKFTDRHRSLYEMMLDVQLQLITHAQVGASLDQLFKIMGRLMVKGLCELGIVSNTFTSKTIEASDIALRFCPHHVSHYLGMDVHDTPSVERNIGLQPGMIITVEPGVYLRAASPKQRDLLTKVGKEFEGLGIRIEDDVLITAGDPVVLTANSPKTVHDIEYWGSKAGEMTN